MPQGKDKVQAPGHAVGKPPAARACGHDREQEGAGCGPEEHAPAEAFHPAPGHEQAPRDDAAVVDERRERRSEELAADVEERRNAGPGQKEDLRGEDDAQKVGQPGLFFRGKARSDQPGQFRGEEPRARRERGDAERRPPEDRGKETPAVRLVLLEAFGQQRDERDGNVAARQQIVEEIRHHEGREIDVGFRARPELPRNDLVPHEPHEPGQKDASRHDQGRETHFMRCCQSHDISF